MSVGRANFGPYEDTWGDEDSEGYSAEDRRRYREAMIAVIRYSGVLDGDEEGAMDARIYIEGLKSEEDRAQRREIQNRLMRLFSEKGVTPEERERRELLSAVIPAWYADDIEIYHCAVLVSLAVKAISRRARKDFAQLFGDIPRSTPLMKDRVQYFAVTGALESLRAMHRSDLTFLIMDAATWSYEKVAALMSIEECEDDE